MAKFSISIQKSHRRKDGTYPVRIKVAWQGDRGFIDPGISVGPKQLNKKFQITDSYVLEDLNSRINKYDKHIREVLRDKELQYTAKELAIYFENFQKNESKKADIIDFISYYKSYIIKVKNKGTAGLYQTTLNSLLRYINPRDVLDINFVTSKFLEDYETWLWNEGLETSGVNLYMRNVRAVFYRAVLDYNDDEQEIFKIRHNPFKKYKIPKVPPTRKRALKAFQIRAIRDSKMKLKRDVFARDIFMLSFYLVGMNTIDLYNLEEIKGNRIGYNRQKTESRRDDQAFISIKIEPEAWPLIEKYKDPTGQKAFDFYKRYSEPRSFNKAVNKGLKNIGSIESVKVDDLEFYAARHSWATIARNDCKISKEDVHECLNHVSEAEMKVTDIYIEKDWSIIDRSNRKVLDLVFWRYLKDCKVPDCYFKTPWNKKSRC